MDKRSMLEFRIDEFMGRELELSLLDDFLQEEGSGLLHIRGRRRIGKSWFLKRAMAEYEECFYFQGRSDSTNRSQMLDFGRKWDLFCDRVMLGKTKDLTWEEIFCTIQSYAESLDVALILILDEVQWIAKKGVGFVSKLKEAWVSWESSECIKLIVSGSSNKFFEDGKSAETRILRGLRTHSDIEIGPFSLKEIQNYIFPKWTQEEICLTYMITGGVPYYLKRISKGKPFIRSINESFFTRKSIFFDEVDEILRLEFNNKSMSNVKEVLSLLGQEGKTLVKICARAKIHEKTIRDILAKLIDYRLVFLKEREGDHPKANRAGAKYIMKDCFLNFYFTVLSKYESQIRVNKSENIFGSKVLASSGFYIEGFTGKAFELLIHLILEESAKRREENGIVIKMGLSHFNYIVGQYWEEGKTEVDRIVKAPDTREMKIIEAKWISNKADNGSAYIDQVLDKDYRPPKRFTLEYFLALSGGWTEPFEKRAKKENVVLLGVQDLF